MHRREALLTVQHDVLAVVVRTRIGIEWFACECLEVFLLAFPEQQAADVIVEKYRTDEVAYVPRLPFELTLKIRNDEAIIKISRYRITRPGLIFRYLLIIMAIISVPPVLLPCENTIPTPAPPSIPPITVDKKASPTIGFVM